MTEKYIAPGTLKDRIRKGKKAFEGASVIWKALVKAFPLPRK